MKDLLNIELQKNLTETSDSDELEVELITQEIIDKVIIDLTTENKKNL